MRQTSLAKTIVETVLSQRRLKEVWTANYLTALPFTPQDFAIEAMLPAILYMFRWGHRRGVGHFRHKFGSDGQITAENVANVLAGDKQLFSGFCDDVTRSILGDLLLTYCVENKNHGTGRTEQVMRAFPTHYFASWIDLPEKVSHLRSVPEMIVSLLTNQEHGTHVEPGQVKSRFSTAQGFDNNALLKHFAVGVSRGKNSTALESDQFEETECVGIDQLLTIRIAQYCGASPVRLRGPGESGQISNRKPLALKVANAFRADLTTFLDAYSTSIPRQALVSMLESCLSLGLTTTLLASILMLLRWERTNSVEDTGTPWQLFVDASLGENNKLRRLSEESFDELMRRLDRLPTVLMTLRVLEQAAGEDEDTATSLKQARNSPHGMEAINLLGSIRNGDHANSRDVLKELSRTCIRLADALEEQDEQPNVVQILRDTQLDAATRLGESLVILMGDGQQRSQFVRAIDSSVMANAPNGLGRRRKVMVSVSGRKRLTEARSIVLTNTMLDYLVHRHLRRGKRGSKQQSLSLTHFLQILADQYGLYIDRSPIGMMIPSELLTRNKTYLERRLRDLGLLVGVNDAESMKRLSARFAMEEQ